MTLTRLAIGVAGLVAGCHGSIRGEQRMDLLLSSPDKTQQVILYTTKGGPAGGGWCEHRLALRASDTSAPDLQELDRTAGYTFEAGCSSNVSVEWRSATELHVVYTMPPQGVSVHEEPLSLDGKVRLSYEYR